MRSPRKLIVAAVLTVALVLPVVASGANPNAPGDPSMVYTPAAAGNACAIEFTRATARTWVNFYLASPVDLNAVNPGLLPGSTVMTDEEYAAVKADNAPGNGLPKAPPNYNPLGLPVTPGIVGADGKVFCPTAKFVAPAPVKTHAYDAAIAKLKVYISKLSQPGARDPDGHLAIYKARLADYQSR